MQQPISLPDDTEDVSTAEQFGDPDQPPPPTVPFPGVDTVADYDEPDAIEPADQSPGAASQRELLLEQHRQRMAEQAGEAPVDSGSFDDTALAFPGAQPTDQPSGGVSQREAIMQQQRDILLRQAGVSSSPTAQHNNESSSEKSTSTGRGWLTRRSAWAVVVIGLSVLLLSGGAAAAGQTGSLDQVAGALTPDVVERWLTENIASFSENADSAATEAATAAATSPTDGRSSSTSAPGATGPTDAPAANAQPLRAQIANTDGTGISVRAICINEARTTATLAEGTAVRIIGRGVGDCSGWSVVRAGAKTSWVEDRFLAAAATR